MTSRDHTFKGLHDLMGGRKLLIVSHQLAKLSRLRYCGSAYTMTLVFHVILQDYLIIIWSCDFIGKSRSR